MIQFPCGWCSVRVRTVGGVLFSRNQLLELQVLLVRASTYFIHNRWLKMDEDRARSILRKCWTSRHLASGRKTDCHVRDGTNSQHALRTWMPAWSRWMQIVSRIAWTTKPMTTNCIDGKVMVMLVVRRAGTAMTCHKRHDVPWTQAEG